MKAFASWIFGALIGETWLDTGSCAGGSAPGGYNNPTMMGGIPKNQHESLEMSWGNMSHIACHMNIAQLQIQPYSAGSGSHLLNAPESWRSEVASCHGDAMVMCLRKLRQKEWLKSCNPWDQRRCNTFWTGKRTFSRRRRDINPRKGNTKKRYTDVFYQKAGMVLRCFEGFPFDIFVFCWLFVDYCSPSCLDVGHFPDSGAVLLHVETCWNSGSLWNHVKSSLESKTNSWDGGYVV